MTKKYDFVIFSMGYMWVHPSNGNITTVKVYDKAAKDEMKSYDVNSDDFYHKFALRPNRSFGPYKIATFLRQHGYSVKCIDFLNSFSLSEVDQLIEKYVSDQTLAVGFSLSFGNWQFEKFEKDFFERAELIKQRAQKRVIVGGWKNTGKNFMDQARFNVLADHVFIDRCERSLLTLLDGIKSNKIDLVFKMNKVINAGKIFPNSDEDDANLALILSKEDDDLFYGEPITVELSRGCIFDCTFCSYEKRGKKKLDYLIHEDPLYQMFKQNYENFGIVNYNAADPTVNDTVEKLEMIARVVDQLEFKPKFFSFLRSELLLRYPEQIDLLARIGYVGGAFGIESLHPQAQKSIRKKISYEDLISLLTSLNEKIPNFNSVLLMIVGLPYETKEHFEQMLNKLIERRDLISHIMMFPLFLEHTDLENIPHVSNFSLNAEEYGYVRSEVNGLGTWKNENNNMTWELANIFVREFAMKVSKMHSTPIPRGFLLGYADFLDNNDLGITLDNFAEKYKEKVLA